MTSHPSMPPCGPDAAHGNIFITDQLALRPPKRTDHLREKRALQDLAMRMADRPAEVLPRFVDLAMEMTGGSAAGLSIFEPDPAAGVFRWRFLRGALSRFNGATTPRNHSPCGITLDHRAPVLSRHPERIYDWISQAGIVVPEVLLVPLFLGGKLPLGTLWVVADQPEHFDSGDARVLTELASFVDLALRMLETEQNARRAVEAQTVLAKEMEHRIKNLFALAEAMVVSGARGRGTKRDVARAIAERLRALASAHGLVQAGAPGADAHGQAGDLGQLLRAVVAPYGGRIGQARPRLSLRGPPVTCGPHATNGLALMFHELATNAFKYGALKAASGRLSVSWKKQGARLVIHWRERGGPPLAGRPKRVGFGTTLLQKTASAEFDGTVVCDWRRDGLSASIDVALDALAQCASDA
jgi:two-component sensor histidine kinase